ncbi:sensor histidine kinase [Planomonospora parontospora]|uniref:sensor histidine kinase n=1 Tax=Planomonospora parontospora TaxID=58119 RepID=UPI0016711D39|nr:nitrate- and nitrite sensing domain-containing protein [Planomonospora parontospora]GGL53328.1 ATPase [Planomonospora parontospora subsp. antibiotica]GII19534.1 ATPase [Planomonospora parontospora subsp. antibiotica]
MSTPRPIRTKILAILLIPLVSLVALWGYNAYATAAQISGIAQSQSRWQEVGAPVQRLVGELRRERQLSAEAAGRTGGRAVLQEQRRATDGAATRLRELVVSIGLQDAADADDATDTAAAADGMRSLLEALDGLGALRSSADGGQAPPLRVTEGYNDLVGLAQRQFNTAETLTDVPSYRIIRGLSSYSGAPEYIARQRAVLTVALARGEMTPAEHTAFVAAMTGRRLVLANAERDMGPELRAMHRELAAGTTYRRFQTAEDEIAAWAGSGAPPVDGAVWNRDSESVLAAFDSNVQRELARAGAKGDALKSAALWRIGLVLGLGLLAVVASIVLSYRFGRSLVDELTRLRASAAELAEERLPRLVERLRRGEDVDPAAEAPELAPSRTAEVDGVVRAFSAVRRTAMEAAVGQAVLRKGVGQVFLNLARRNQALLHRQLALLDVMERRTEDPETLEDLFKVDHLTTRMRRHAENLIVLSGAAPARRWRDPVPVFDVVRSAVLEVEDYTRVTVLPMPDAPLLVGGAVTDVIHLVAELVENATAFSPPGTAIHVRGMPAANGFSIEVEDRGLGLGQVCVDTLNGRLADPPEFDPADSDRLGLFVVSRLAARHGIRVVLRPSPYDGATAIVLLPNAVLAAPGLPYDAPYGEPPTRTDRPVRGGGPRRALSAVPDAVPAAVPDAVRETAPAAVPDAARDVVPAAVPRTVRDTAPDPAPRSLFTPVETPPPQTPQAPVLPPHPVAETGHPLPAQREPVCGDPDDLDGLPVRVRQASLAPQLRRSRPARQPDLPTNRSPEEILDRMSSMQRGWQQGRSQAERHSGPWNDPRNGKEGHPDGRPQI